jgi:hypothetical protein
MNEDWCEKPCCFICDKWWLILLLLVLLLSAFFTRDLWLDQLGLRQPETSRHPREFSELGTGDVQVTLIWNTTDDLDLWVIDPEGVQIYFNRKTSPSGGELDVDANAGCGANVTITPVENIFWPTGGAPIGTYTVKVHYFSNCGSTRPLPYTAFVKVDGVEQEFSGEIVTENEVQTITSFER